MARRICACMLLCLLQFSEKNTLGYSHLSAKGPWEQKQLWITTLNGCIPAKRRRRAKDLLQRPRAQCRVRESGGTQWRLQVEGCRLNLNRSQTKNSIWADAIKMTLTCRKINWNISDLNCKASFKYAGAIFILIAPRWCGELWKTLCQQNSRLTRTTVP